MHTQRSSQIPVDIRSRDYWLKALENQQTNWALIDEDLSGRNCTVFFFHELSGVFDRMSFSTIPTAEAALRFNGFDRLAEEDVSQQGAPRAPFFEDIHPNSRIYSSGKFWRDPPASGN